MGLDVSGSVDTGEYQLQIHGLAAALTSRDVTSSILSMPKAPVRLIMRQPNQPVGYKAIIATDLCLIAITGLAYGLI